jgi:DNA replication ATP-dependent helicase Dna2
MIAGFSISSKKSKSPCIVSGEADDSVKAVFVDTDKVPALDSRVGDLVQNETEGELVHQLATALTSSGVAEEDIAVITPYRQQIKLLSNKFGSMPGIEILTADKSQGRDKDCIIISLVRSNDLGNVSSLTGTRIS